MLMEICKKTGELKTYQGELIAIISLKDGYEKTKGIKLRTVSGNSSSYFNGRTGSRANK